MPNIFKNEEQRKRWNEYNRNYSKLNYKTFTIKLNKEKDKDIIDYFASQEGKTATDLVKELVRQK